MLKDTKLSYVEGCLVNEEKITQIEKDLKKTHDEIIDSLKFIEAMIQSTNAELIDVRQGITIILESHGIPCDEISGWDLNTYRENRENKEIKENKENKYVRGSRIQGSRLEITNVDNGKSVIDEREDGTRKRRWFKNARRK